MAKYDVYIVQDNYVIDVQDDLLSDLNIRVVIPLILSDQAPQPARRLNPVFEINGKEMILVTQYIGSVDGKLLTQPIANLSEHFDEITNALDMLFQGF